MLMANNYILKKTLGTRFARLVLAAVLLLTCGQAIAQSQCYRIVGTTSRNISYLPFYSWVRDSYAYTQQVYLASELTTQGMTAGTVINRIGFQYAGTRDFSISADIFMGHTSNPDLSTICNEGLVRVFAAGSEGTISFSNINGTGGTWCYITLSTPFVWNGTDNIVVAINQLVKPASIDNNFVCHATTTAEMGWTTLGHDPIELNSNNVPEYLSLTGLLNPSDEEMQTLVSSLARNTRPNIEFCHDDCPALGGTFAFQSGNYSVNISDNPTPAVNKALYNGAEDPDVTYTSSNNQIALVNYSNGTVSFTGQPGRVVITATLARAGYCPRQVSYAITINDNCDIRCTGPIGNPMSPARLGNMCTWNQMIYTGADVGRACRIHSIAFRATEANPSQRWARIYMGKTNKTSFDNQYDFIPKDQLTLVYSGRWNVVEGWNKFDFNMVSGFEYDNLSENIVIAMDVTSTDAVVQPTPFYYTQKTGTVAVCAYTEDWRNMPAPEIYDTAGWASFDVDPAGVTSSDFLPEIDFCMNCCTMRAANFKYSSASVDYAIGTEFVAPTLSATPDGIYYQSSDVSVATVDASGNVTFTGNPGTTIISAHLDATSEYCAQVAQYLIAARVYPKITYVAESSTCTGTASGAPPIQGGIGLVHLSMQTPSCSTTDISFQQWNTKADGTGDSYFPGSEFMLVGDTTLYAIYGTRCCIPDSALTIEYTYKHHKISTYSYTDTVILIKDTVKRDIDGYYNFNICKGDTMVSVVATPRGDCTPSTGSWYFSYANHYHTYTRANTTTFIPGGEYYTPVFDSVVGYDLNYVTMSGGCQLRMPGRVRVSGGVLVNDFDTTAFPICPGSPTYVTIGYNTLDSNFVQVASQKPSTSAVLSKVEGIFLPDGTSCDVDGAGVGNPASCHYESSIEFYQFQDGARVRSVEDILYLQMKIEHSYIGDLLIKLICPADPETGERREAVILKKYQEGNSDCATQEHIAGTSHYNRYYSWGEPPSTWRDPETGQTVTNFERESHRAFFGLAVDECDNCTTDKCNPNATKTFSCSGQTDRHVNRIGEAWNYVWSCAQTHGYEYAKGAGHKIYEIPNHNHDAGPITHPIWDKGCSKTDKNNVVDSSHFSEMKNIYSPDESFERLVECPLNGFWTIYIVDGYANDNGWLVDWSIGLNDSLIRDEWTYNWELDSAFARCDWFGNGQYSKSTDHFVVTPPSSLTDERIHVHCNMYTIDDYGCNVQDTISLNFRLKDFHLNEVVTKASCANNDGRIEVNPTGGVPPYQYSFDNEPFSYVNYREHLRSGTHSVQIIDAEECMSRAMPVEVERDSIHAATASTPAPIVCGGSETGSFTITVTGGTAPYLFYIEDTLYRHQENNVGVFDNLPAGNYTVVVSDGNNACPDTIHNVIIANLNPPFEVTIDPPSQANGCPLPNGQNYELNASFTGGVGPFTYQWKGSTAVSNLVPGPTNTRTARATVASDGLCHTYNDTLIIVDHNNCTDTTAIAFATIMQQPVIGYASGFTDYKDWGCDNTFAAPTAASFTVTDNCKATASVNVSAGDEVITGCQHSRTWTATYTNGCGQSADPVAITYEWTVAPQPTVGALPEFITAIPVGSDCQYRMPNLAPTVLAVSTDGCGGTVTFVGQSIDSTGASSLFTQTVTGDTIVATATVRGTCNVENSATVNIVIPKNDLTLTDNTANNTVAGDTAVCPGNSITLTGSATSSAGIDNYHWSSTTDPTINEDGASLTVSPTATNSYTVTVTDENGCTTSRTINVALNHDATIALDNTGGSTSGAVSQEICLGESLETINLKFDYSTLQSITIDNGTLVLTDNSATTGKVSLSGKPETDATYTLTAVSNQSPACQQDQIIISIIVNDTVKLNDDAVSQSICLGESITPIPIIYSNSTISLDNALAAGLSITSPDGTDTITGRPTTAGVYTYVVTAASNTGCAGSNKTKSITITVRDTVSLTIADASNTQTQTICLGENITPIPVIYGNSTISFSTPLTDGLVITAPDGTDTITGKPVSNGEFTYVITASSTNGCTDYNKQETVTITVNDTVKLNIDGTKKKQTICLGESITPIPVTYSNAAISLNTPLAADLVITSPDGTDTVSGRPLAAGVYEYIITAASTNNCASYNKTDTITITVKDTVKLEISDASNTQTQTICLGENITPIPVIYENSTISFSTPLTDGLVITTPADGTDTITGKPLSNGEFTYVITATSNNGCTSYNKQETVTITVNDTVNLAIDDAVQTQAKCLGVDITPIPVIYSNATISFNTPLTANLVITAPDGTDTITGRPATAGDYTYIVTAASTNGCTSYNKQETITLSIIDTVQPAISCADTICESTSETNTVLTIQETNGGAGDTYTWTVGENGTILSGQGTNTITASWSTRGNKTITVTVAHGALNCTGYTEKTIYVEGVPTLTLDAAADTVCPTRDTVSLVATLTNADNATYTYTYTTPLTLTPSSTTTTTAVSDTTLATIPRVCDQAYAVNLAVTDNHGCTVSIEEDTIRAIDNTHPTVTGSIAAHTVEGCSSDLSTLYPALTTAQQLIDAFGITISDACTPLDSLIVSHNDVKRDSSACAINVKRTYTIEDFCGNGVMLTQNITINTPDGYTFSAVEDTVVVSCADWASGLTAPNTQIVLPTVTDACNHPVSVTSNTPTPVTDMENACKGKRDYTFNFANCGHDTTWTFTYIIELPLLNMANPTVFVDTVPCISAATGATTFNIPSSDMYDACGNLVTPVPLDGDGNVMTVATADTNVDIHGNGNVTYNWRYTDCAGREYLWQRVHIIEAGEFNGLPNVEKTVQCDSAIVAPHTPDSAICGEPITFDAPNITTDYNVTEGCYKHIYSYHYVVYGRDYTWTYTYILNPARFTLPDNGIDTVECIADTNLPTYPVVLNTCGDQIVPTGPVRSITNHGCRDTVVYTYNYEDCTGYNVNWTYTYIINPTTVPHEVPNPTLADSTDTVECFSAAVPRADNEMPKVVSQCGEVLTPVDTTFVDQVDANGVTGSRTYTYTYNDCAGNEFTWDFTYDVIRVTPPHEEPNPTLADTSDTVKCHTGAVRPQLPLMVDVCGNVVEPSADSSIVYNPGGSSHTNSGCEDTVVYQYLYRDSAGLETPWSFIYYVQREDTDVPQIVAPIVPNGDTVECFSDAVEPSQLPTVVDICGDTISDTVHGHGSIDISYVDHNDTPCTGSRVYTYTYTDCTGRLSTQWQFTYTVEHPALQPLPDTVINVTCLNEATSPTVPPTAPKLVNACGDTILGVMTPAAADLSGVDSHDSGTVVYHFVYTDCDGTETTWSYIFEVNPDEFHAPADSAQVVACIGQVSAPAAATMPEIVVCNETIPYTDLTSPTVTTTGNDSCGTVTYTYHYTVMGRDYTWSFTDTIRPEPFVVPASVVDTVECIADTSRPTTPVVLNTCNDTIKPTGPAITATAHGCRDTVVFTYNYKDCTGYNVDWSYTYIINLTTIPHEEPNPTLADSTDTVECFSAAVPRADNEMPKVVSQCGEVLTPIDTTFVDQVDANGVTGSRTYTYTYNDCAGNEFTWEFTYDVIRVTPPHEEPNPTLADTSDTVKCHTGAVRPQLPLIVDVCGNVVEPSADSSIVYNPGGSSHTNSGCEDTVVYQYLYRDSAGLETPWSFIYYVQREDTDVPQIVAPIVPNGDTVACFSDAVEPSQLPTVVDACGDTISDTVHGHGSIDISYVDHNDTPCKGSRVYTYTYTDCTGRLSTQWQFTYTVEHPALQPLADTVKQTACLNEATTPAITPTAPALVNACGDTIEGVMTPAAPDLSGIDAHDSGRVVYHFVYTDCDGTETTWEYIYEVDPDEFQPPADSAQVVACIGQVSAPAAATMPEIVVCNETIPYTDLTTPTVTSTGNDSCGTVTYTYHYTVMGRDYTWSFTDTIRPEPFVVPASVVDTIECYNVATNVPTLPVVSNSCGDVIEYSSVDIDSSDYNGCSGEIVYTYTYHDCAGYTAQWQFTYVIHHTTQPYIIQGADYTTDSTVACVEDAVPGFRVPVMSDVCGRVLDAPVFEIIEPCEATNCQGQRTYRYYYYDCDGVNTIWNFMYSIHDTVPPTIDPIDPQDAVLTGTGCHYQVPDLSFEALNNSYDNCGGTVVFDGQTPSASELFDQPLTDGTVTVTVRVRDECGNVQTRDVEVSVPGSGISVTLTDGNGYEHSTAICSGDTVQLSAAATTNNGNPTYRWTPATALSSTTAANVSAWPTQDIAYTVTVTDNNGCSQSANMVVTVHQLTSTAFRQSVCDTYTWYSHNGDIAYTQSGTYYDNYLTADGCPSTDTLYLTVNYNVYADEYDTICTGETIIFAGRQYNTSGDYDGTFLASNGCDSIVTLHLTVAPNPSVRIQSDYSCDDGSYTLVANTQAPIVEWQSIPPMAEFNQQAHQQQVVFVPYATTFVTLYAGYPGMMQCAVRDTTTLIPVTLTDAAIEVTPEVLNRDYPDWTAIDRSKNVDWRQWYVDGMYYGVDEKIGARADEAVDSVVIILIVGNSMCTDTAEVVLPMLREGVYVPNVFTPELAINRQFGASGVGIIEYHLDIYNRNGLHVFHSDDLNDQWKGDHNGVECPTGSYVWHIVYRTEVYPDVRKEIVGQVLLLR